MSFLKITDPKKIDFIVNEFLKTKAEHPTKHFIRTCRWLEHTIRTFKALQTSYGHAKDLKEGLVSELKPTRKGMKKLPKAITFPQFPFITACDDNGEKEEDVFRGDIADL